MTLRISRVVNGDLTTLRLEGDLDAVGVEDLRAECTRAEFATRLDLSGLRHVEEVGLEAIRALRKEGVVLHGGSFYIRRLLKEDR